MTENILVLTILAAGIYIVHNTWKQVNQFSDENTER